MSGTLRLVEKPNLPQGTVRLLLMGARYIPRLNLSEWGIDNIALFPYTLLELPLVEHADMQVLHIYKDQIASNNCILCKVIELYKVYIEKNSCKVEDLVIKPFVCKRHNLMKYPESAAYNVLILGEFAVFNPKCVDPVLCNMLKSSYQCIPVRQGYARCASCVVQENAVITADPEICRVLRRLNFDVLQIEPGYITLPGYSYGFIGGATFKIAPDKIAFTGRLDAHPDAEQILHFIKAHGVEPVFLSNELVFDIGSAIPLIEEFS